jgi:four helix bundle protein
MFIFKKIFPILPREEKYRLGDQFIRAGRSTTTNIAEGYGRYHYLDNAKFCSISRGSCWEILDHLITANDENLISAQLLSEGRELVQEAVKYVNGYMNYLKRAAKKYPAIKEDPIEYDEQNYDDLIDNG